jgi:hypothetical protein
MDLKPIDRTDRGRNRLNAALKVYRELIRPDEQNPEREILYWIDHSKDALTDEFRCFAIQSDGEVVGYLQYSYYREEHIFFFEYFCLRSRGRRGLLSNPAIRVVQRHLSESHRPGFIVVFECAKTRSDFGTWSIDKRRVDYFQRLGFRKLDFDYSYPVLQEGSDRTSFPADLMVLLPEGRYSVTATEMRTMLRCIYFKHYLRWDRPFLDTESFAQRERLIDELYSSVIAHIKPDDQFPTEGTRRANPIWKSTGPSLRALVVRLFGPKLPRLLTVMGALLVAQWALGNGWLLVPFVIAVAVIYCLAEDTPGAERLFLALITKLRLGRPRQL